MKYSVELKKTIYVQVEAENMYDVIEQLENHDLCKKDGYMIRNAELMEECENACESCKGGGKCY